jgi:hypothetical protein
VLLDPVNWRAYIGLFLEFLVAVDVKTRTHANRLASLGSNRLFAIPQRLAANRRSVDVVSTLSTAVSGMHHVQCPD